MTKIETPTHIIEIYDNINVIWIHNKKTSKALRIDLTHQRVKAYQGDWEFD